MHFGICGGPDRAGAAARAGYDFLESTVGALLKPRESEEAFAEALATHRAAPLPCPVVNCFVPGDLKITGPEVERQALTDYVTVACERAKQAGVETIVFGSGGARRIPEEFDRAEAQAQLVAFGRMVGPVAQANGVTIAVEPLNKNACNVLTTVGESAAYVREVDHPAVRLLVDAYHWGVDQDSAEDIAANGSLLVHTHIATIEHRRVPGAEACDFEPFFAALKRGGYDGRVSIEAGGIEDPEAELTQALRLMRELG